MSLFIGAVVINLIHATEGLMFYDAMTFILGLIAMLLLFFLFSCLGVLVSLKADTVRQAYQRLSLSMLVIWLVPFVLGQLLPKEILNNLIAQAPNMEQILIASVPYLLAGLLVLALVLYRIARGKFQRTTLIADL